MPNTAPSTTLARKKLRILRWIVGIFFLFLTWFLFQLLGPSPKIVVSKQTTYITSPLRPDGLPDFERYMLERNRTGVTPENNAAILLVQALWPADLQPQDYTVVVNELGLAQAPSTVDALVPMQSEASRARLIEWLTQLAGEAKPNRETGQEAVPSTDAMAADEVIVSAAWPDLSLVAVESMFDQVTRRPWTSAQLPPLGKWIEENQKPIDLILAATKRPKCYFPSPSLLNNEYGTLIGVALPGLNASREAARALAARCMWNVGEGRLDAAWQDAMAIHRLARLVGQGQFVVEELVAISIESVACQADIAVLGDSRLKADLARQILNELNSLAPPTDMARALQDCERVTALDAALFVRSRGIAALTGTGQSDFFEQAPTWLSIDWNIVLSELNHWHDGISIAASYESRAMRKQALARIDDERVWAGRQVTVRANMLGSVVSRKVRSQAMANILVAIILTPGMMVSESQDRGNTLLDLTRVAAALAVYRAEEGRYPQKLEGLSPRVLNSMPVDIFSDQPFIYRSDENGKGYLLYSVFRNEVDNGGDDVGGQIVDGEWVESDHNSIDYGESDLVIRLPLPLLKLPKPPASK